MLWTHPDHPERALRLAYCLNLHPAEDLDGVLEGMGAVTLPLRDRLAPGASFGVGLWLPAALARSLAAGGQAFERLAAFLAAERLDPFTFNAFPYGGFHRAGLKEGVYSPAWTEDERADFTIDVARVAARLARCLRPSRPSVPAHLSISSHPGAYGAWIERAAQLEHCARSMGRVLRELARLEAEEGARIVLSLEAEPRASAGDSRELWGFLAFARAEAARAWIDLEGREPGEAHALAARHLGTCLDACHSAVEFEEPEAALATATRGGPLGKLQFSSALALPDPGRASRGRALLLSMDEPVYLHQIVGRRGGELLHAADLPELAAVLDAPDTPWLACQEWRCHFHVPIDLAEVGEGLSTTRAHADALLQRLIARPHAWPTPELHVELETYTWHVLPAPARGAGELADGLEREYRHVLLLLERAGWRPLEKAAAPR